MDMAEFGRMVALKAVISTFDELLNSCTIVVDGMHRCLICDADWHDDDADQPGVGCSPHCVRVRAERAMTFLTKGGG